jgi:serine/threonine protein kinase
LLEICTNQTLNELIKRRKRLTEMEVSYYLQQIVNSLVYLHNNKVIHREYPFPHPASNSATSSSTRTWRSSWEISDWPPG